MSSVEWGLNAPTVLHEDKLGTFKLARCDKYDPRTKHIGMKYHYMRRLVRENQVSAVHVPVDSQRLDILTNCPGPIKFIQLRRLAIGQ